jgi:hypothetical protein
VYCTVLHYTILKLLINDDSNRTFKRILLRTGLFAKINCRRLVGTTLLKGDDEDMFYLKGEDMSYLMDEKWRRHVLVV